MGGIIQLDNIVINYDVPENLPFSVKIPGDFNPNTTD